jgi:hypothetical protein
MYNILKVIRVSLIYRINESIMPIIKMDNYTLEDLDSEILKEGIGGYGYFTSNSPFHRSTFVKAPRIPNVTANVLGYQSYFFDQNRVGPMGAGSRMNQLLDDLRKKGVFKGVYTNAQSIGEIKDCIITRSTWDEGNQEIVTYIKLIFSGGEFWGTMRGLNTYNPSFKTEMEWKDKVYASPDFLIRLEGLLIERLREWYHIMPGEFVTLEDLVTTDQMGGVWKILSNTPVKSIGTDDWWKPFPTCHLKADGKMLKVCGKTYWFLKYKLKEISDKQKTEMI